MSRPGDSALDAALKARGVNNSQRKNLIAASKLGGPRFQNLLSQVGIHDLKLENLGGTTRDRRRSRSRSPIPSKPEPPALRKPGSSVPVKAIQKDADDADVDSFLAAGRKNAAETAKVTAAKKQKAAAEAKEREAKEKEAKEKEAIEKERRRLEEERSQAFSSPGTASSHARRDRKAEGERNEVETGEAPERVVDVAALLETVAAKYNKPEPQKKSADASWAAPQSNWTPSALAYQIAQNPLLSGAAFSASLAQAASLQAQNPIDREVQELADHFDLDKRITKDLDTELKKRPSTAVSDLDALWGILEDARCPHALLRVKIGEMQANTFIGAPTMDKDIKQMQKMYKLDAQATRKLAEWIQLRPETRERDLERLHRHLETSNKTSARVMQLVGKTSDIRAELPKPDSRISIGSYLDLKAKEAEREKEKERNKRGDRRRRSPSRERQRENPRWRN